ncbi:MAG TPA: alpha/beta family hydrolase [Terriglobales bacterium]|nr:alpha/beta family hydrolase [Terriglobales bacterium]
MSVESFSNSAFDPAVRGYLHRPDSPSGDALALTHGAGGNAQSGLLVAIAEAFAAAGIAVLRCDLPFRQVRRFGPPRPGDATRDRKGLANALAATKALFSGQIFLGGQSYGGRQASMLCAEEKVGDGLLLFSYPLHPPGKPEQLRTQHLPQINVPVLFVHGSRDPFGSIDEIESARKLIPAETLLMPVEGVGHDLGFKGKTKREDLSAEVHLKFRQLFGQRT